MCIILALSSFFICTASGFKVIMPSADSRYVGFAQPPNESACNSDEVGLQHACMVKSGKHWKSMCASIGMSTFRNFDECRLTLRGWDLNQKHVNRAERQTRLSTKLKQRANTRKPVLYFLGDSTLRNLFKAFCYLLDPVANGLAMNPQRDTITSCNNENATAVLFYSWHSWRTLGQGIQAIVDSGYPRATDVVMNTGLHRLHLSPARNWSIVDFQDWKRYGSDLNHILVQTTKALPRAHIAVMTTHSICKAKFYGIYRDLADLSDSDPMRAAVPCARGLTRDGVGTTDAKHACRQGFFTRPGVMVLNSYVKRTIKSMQSSRIRAMDSFHLTDGQCGHTENGDGRHYNTLILNQTDLLFNSLQWPVA